MPRGAWARRGSEVPGEGGLWGKGNTNKARRTPGQSPAIPGGEEKEEEEEEDDESSLLAVGPGQPLWHPQGAGWALPQEGKRIKRAGQPQKCSFLLLCRCQEGLDSSSSSSSRQGRVHPDPAELELPFNQLHLPELLHPKIHLQPQVQVSFHLKQLPGTQLGLSPTLPLCECHF